MKIYFNNLNIFTWKISIYSPEAVKSADISNKESQYLLLVSGELVTIKIQ